MAYSEKVIDHYTNPRNVGSFAKGEENVGTGVVGAPECGDVMKLQLKINPENGVIEDAKFKTFGCGSAIASSSYVTELVKGKHVDEAMAIKNTVIVKELNLPPVKIHCSVLAEDAIKAAITDWRSIRRQQRRPTSPKKARGGLSERDDGHAFRKRGQQDQAVDRRQARVPACASKSWAAAVRACSIGWKSIRPRSATRFSSATARG